MVVGNQVDEIDVDFRLPTLKSLHAQWLISLYNHFSTERGAQIVNKGWKISGKSGTVTPPPVNPSNQL